MIIHMTKPSNKPAEVEPLEMIEEKGNGQRSHSQGNYTGSNQTVKYQSIKQRQTTTAGSLMASGSYYRPELKTESRPAAMSHNT